MDAAYNREWIHNQNKHLYEQVRHHASMACEPPEPGHVNNTVAGPTRYFTCEVP